MKVTSVSKTNYDATSSKNSVQSYAYGLNNEQPKDSVSFGGVGSALKDKTTGLFKWIEKSGFFVEFLIIDTFSMILPRIWVGLNRDKEKTGKFNYKAGAEEAGREVTSGPSMQLIPMGLLAGICVFKPSSRMGRDTLKALTANMHEVVENVSDLSKKEKIQKALADKIFDDAFGKYENKKEIDAFKNDFSKLLTDSVNVKKKLFNNDAFNNNVKEFEELVVKINNKGVLKKVTDKDGKEVFLEDVKKENNSKGFINKVKNKVFNQNNVDENIKEVLPLNTEMINLSKIEEVTKDGVKISEKKRVAVKSGDLIEDFRCYSKDIISKLADSTFVDDKAKNAKEFLSGIQNRRLGLKTASAIAAFMAVGSFLLYLPRLYQQGSVSPAEESAKRAQAEALAAKGGAR